MIDFAAARVAMVDCQVRPSDVTQYPIIDAMLSVPREAFVPSELREVAYAGEHISLGGSRVVLDPRVMGKMLDALSLRPDDLVLDVGCGLGYSTALLARLCEMVIGVEEDADMAAEASTNLSSENVDNAVINEGRLAEGDASHGLYDALMIQGGIEVLPEALADQLKEGGRVAAIFVSGTVGHMRLGLKTAGRINWRTEFDAFAPVLPGFEASEEFRF